MAARGWVGVLLVWMARVGFDESSSSIVEGRMYAEILFLSASLCEKSINCVLEH